MCETTDSSRTPYQNFPILLSLTILKGPEKQKGGMFVVRAVAYVFLDVAPDLLAQGEVLGQGSLDDLIEGLNVHGHSFRGGKTRHKHPHTG